MSGKLITFECPDGGGKGYQTRALVARIKRTWPDLNPLLTHEPWARDRYGRLIRKILTHKVTEIDPGDGRIIPEKMQYLYILNRGQHFKGLIGPAMKKGRVTIADRYELATLAYGNAYGVDPELIMGWHRKLMIPEPDAVIYLRTSVDTCLQRMAIRGEEPEYYDKREAVERVVASYEELIEAAILPNIYVINNEGTKIEVRERVWEIVREILGR